MNIFVPPPYDCPKCPRLCGFREQNKKDYPHFFNGPVPSFGELSAKLLIVGLAPGLKGANQTGRPFTGDYAGLILYAALQKFGFAKGDYRECANDGLTLANCRISNAVRCVPPENKPETSEIKNCNAFLSAEIKAMEHLKLILSLGLISHNAVLKALGHKASHAKFAHGAVHYLVPPPVGGRLGGGKSSSSENVRPLPNPSMVKKRHPDVVFSTFEPNAEGIILLDSYHCSRYNINTGTLTPVMFDAIMEKAKQLLA